MQRFVFLLVVGTVLVAGHPSSLECGTDDTTRLKIGSNIMAKASIAGNEKADDVKVTVSTATVEIDAPAGVFFALRLQGGGSLAPTDSTLNSTADCSVQVYTTTAAGGKYVANLKDASADAQLILGYSKSGPPVKIVEVSASAAPQDVVAMFGRKQVIAGADCHDTKDQKSCDAMSSCTWCNAKAVPSACYTTAEAKQLPPAVFVCDQK